MLLKTFSFILKGENPNQRPFLRGWQCPTQRNQEHRGKAWSAGQ